MPTYRIAAKIAGTQAAYYSRIVYRGGDLDIAAFYGCPRGEGPFPAIVYNRGGSRDFGALKGPEIAPFVQAGYVAVASQYRGGPGSGGEDEYGGADVADVLALLEVVAQLPEVDPDRIGMVGASRGGMMTYVALKEEALAGRHRVRAAATLGGVSDLFMWARQRPEIAWGLFLPLIGTLPDMDPEPFRRRSATYWPELIDCPLLLVHGEQDDQVSVDHSRTLSNLLRAAGRQVELVTFPGEGHSLAGVQRGYPAVISWLQRHLALPGEDLSYEAHADQITAAVAEVEAALGTSDGPVHI